jgi:hypothetical protein
MYRPTLPKTVDPRIISSILERETVGGIWRRVTVCESLSIYEHVLPSLLVNEQKVSLFESWSSMPMVGEDNKYSAVLKELVSNDGLSLNNVRTTRCRRASQALTCTPINVFLSLMNAQLWPRVGHSKILKEIDDHADVIGVEVSTVVGKTSITRRLSLSRFWTLDDDGVYVITLNSTHCPEFLDMIQVGFDVLFV